MTSAEVGKYIKAEVTATNSEGAVTALSAASSQVAPNVPEEGLVYPSSRINGTIPSEGLVHWQKPEDQ